MKLIELYIIKRIFALFSIILLCCTLLTWLVEILGKINIITTNGQSLLSFLYLSLLFVPSVLIIVIPFAIAITSAQILHSLNYDSEMVIIANAGRGKLYIWRPIIAIGIILSILLFFLANFISPIARFNMRQLMAHTNASFLTNIIQENSFFELHKNLYLKIGERNISSSLNNIFIADERDKNLISYYYAKSATIIEKQNSYLLVMEKGVIAQHNNKSNENSLISFNSYNFDLSTFMPSNNKVQFYPKDLALKNLAENKNLAYKAELHYRLTSWLYPLIFNLFALFFAGSPTSHREAKTALPLSLTSLCCLLFYLANLTIKNKAAFNSHMIILLYLLPFISFASLGLIRNLDMSTKLNFLNKKLIYGFKK